MSNLTTTNWLNTMSNTISNLIGKEIEDKYIYSDEMNWYYYIPAKSLHRGHPLIMNHYRGSLFIVIPHEDYKQLEDGSFDVQEYIDSSFWNFGYFWGGGSMLNGVYWQPIEKEAGIHDTEKLKRYLSILKCRTHLNSSGYMPSEQNCADCYLESCPFSPFKSAGSSWEDEISENDDRKKLFEVVSNRINRTFGFTPTCCFTNKGSNTILMFPSIQKDTVTVHLPQNILIDMLYHPGKYDIEETANSLAFEIGLPFLKERTLVPDDVASATEFCYKFWKTIKTFRWFESHTSTETKKTDSIDEVRDVSIFTKIANFFKSLF